LCVLIHKRSERESVMQRKTCLDCKYYSMDGGKEMGRMSFDFCTKKQVCLPTAAFCFDDLCCPNGSYFNRGAFLCLEGIAKNCDDYKKKK